jgi:hypothetical protein
MSDVDASETPDADARIMLLTSYKRSDLVE